MIYAVVDTRTKSMIYAVKNDCHNACTERDTLNDSYPMLEQPYAVISGKASIQKYCNIKDFLVHR